MSIEVQAMQVCEVSSQSHGRLSVALRSGSSSGPPYQMYWPSTKNDDGVSCLWIDRELAVALRDALVEYFATKEA
jgi:hypothetical protein